MKESKKVSVELTDEQINTILNALASKIRINTESVEHILNVCGKTQETTEIEKEMSIGIMKMKELMKNLHFSKTIYND